MYYIVSFLVSAGGIFYIANSGHIQGIILQNGYTSALIFAVVLSLVNLILGTILRFITFPLKLITLWLFSFVVSFILVYITDEFVPTVSLNWIIPIIAIAVITTITSFAMKLFK
jgi:putative membrane protein